MQDTGELVHRAFSEAHRIDGDTDDGMRLILCSGWWVPFAHYQTVGTHPTCLQCIAAHF